MTTIPVLIEEFNFDGRLFFVACDAGFVREQNGTMIAPAWFLDSLENVEIFEWIDWESSENEAAFKVESEMGEKFYASLSKWVDKHFSPEN